MYKIEGASVYYDSNLIFQVPGEIRYFVSYDDTLIVNYVIPVEDENLFSEEEIYRNVVCINSSGEMIWRIQQLPRSETLPFRPRFEAVGFEEDGALWAYDGGGWENLIDPETGKILDREFTK